MASIPPINYRSPVRRPTILLGSSTSLLGRPLISAAAANRAGLYGIDLDLRSAWRCPSIEDLRESPTTRIRSVWLPSQYAGAFSELRTSRLQEFLNHAATQCGLRTIVLPKTTPVRRQGIPLGRVAQHLSDLYGVRSAVSISADSLMREAGSHLEHVANMRRVAEEWDLDIALDLTTPGIDQWEAEAALMRLFPRLGIVRIRPWQHPSGAVLHSSTARAGLRTVSMLADQAYNELISIAPYPVQPSWISALFPPKLVATQQTREEVLSVYDRIHHYSAEDQHTNRYQR